MSKELVYSECLRETQDGSCKRELREPQETTRAGGEGKSVGAVPTVQGRRWAKLQITNPRFGCRTARSGMEIGAYDVRGLSCLPLVTTDSTKMHLRL